MDATRFDVGPTGAPLEILKALENTEVPETYSGEFECEVSREDAEGAWFFGAQRLSSSNKHVISSRRGRHGLSVKDVNKADQGQYSFAVGDLKMHASLKMKCESGRFAFLAVCTFGITNTCRSSKKKGHPPPGPLTLTFCSFRIFFSQPIQAASKQVTKRRTSLERRLFSDPTFCPIFFFDSFSIS